MADQRARIVPKGKDLDRIFGPSGGGNTNINILQPIKDQGGLIFPYTPTISGAGGSVNYESQEFTHSNYSVNSYQNTQVAPITIIGKFTAQTEVEARYMLAVIHFCKSMTKFHSGVQAGDKAGVPPPIFHFNYLGTYQYKNIPVIITTYNYDFTDDVDYVPVTFGDNDADTTYVPTMITLSLTLSIQPNPATLRNEFNLDTFTTGALLRDRGNRSGFM